MKCYTIEEAAEIIGVMNPNNGKVVDKMTMQKILRILNIAGNNNIPHHTYAEKGWVRIKSVERGVFARNVVLITEDGIVYLRELLEKNNYMSWGAPECTMDKCSDCGKYVRSGTSDHCDRCLIDKYSRC